MHRRKFLATTASATALGIAGCTQEPGDRSGSTDTTTDGGSGPGSQPEGTEGVTETNTPEAETPEPETPDPDGDSGGASGQAWGSNSTEDGVPYSFTSYSPVPGENRDVADISFDAGGGEVTVEGTISGRDACKRATLGSLSYDESAGTLAVGIETTQIEECEKGGAGAQVLVGIEYEATFSFEGDLPSEVTVSHSGREVASVTTDSSSASATPPGTTTST